MDRETQLQPHACRGRNKRFAGPCRRAGPAGGGRFMVHFTCDFCGKELEDGADRFVVKIEVFAAREPAEITEADLDEDNLEAVAQHLQESEEESDGRAPEPTT